MNNWRLLLALVAVFQPISSFTEHKLVDGRQQCCDRQSPTPLGDTRFSLHETYQLRKVTPALRRLNDWDETREDRRYELRQRNSLTQRRSTERSLVDAKARDTRLARFDRVKGNLGRIVIEQRLFDLRARERATANNRASKDDLGHDRTIIYRRSTSKDNRFNRFSNERLFKNVFDSQRDMQRMLFRFEESRFPQNRVRAARDVRDDAARSNLNNQDLITRESLRAERRETFGTRNHVDTNNERRDMKRHNEQRRSLSGITRLSERVGSLRGHLNSRKADRENYHPISAAQRLTERINEIRHGADQRESNSPERIQMTRRESREHTQQGREIRIRYGNNLPHEKTIMEQRNKHESRNLHNIPNERVMDDRREIRYEKRITEIRMNRGEPDESVSWERSQIDRRNIRSLRTMNNMVTRNERHLTREKETRFDERSSKENRENIIDHSLSREGIHIDHRNIRNFRIMNNMVTRNVRVALGRRDIRHDETPASNMGISDRLTRERIQMDRRNVRDFRTLNKVITRHERDIESSRGIRFNERLSNSKRENLDGRLSHERVEMDRKNILGSRIMDNSNERHVLSRREMRYNGRLSREIREEINGNSERNLVRENRQMNREDIRESRTIRSMPSRNERDIDNRREIRLIRQINNGYPTSERRIESRSLGRISGGKHALASRRVRSEDRRNFLDVTAESTQRRYTRFERATRHERHSKAENRNGESLESSSRYVQETRNREISSVMVTKMDVENDTTVATWQYVLYTMQGAYLCALFMQIFTPSQPGKRHNIMSLPWLPQSSNYNPIKVD